MEVGIRIRSRVKTYLQNHTAPKTDGAQAVMQLFILDYPTLDHFKSKKILILHEMCRRFYMRMGILTFYFLFI